MSAEAISGYEWKREPRFDWQVMAVLAAEPDDITWAYTNGLYERFRHSEILVSGLPILTAQHVLNALGRMVKNGAVFAEGMIEDTILTGPCQFRRIHPARTYPHLGTCLRNYGGLGFPALQLVWPDPDERFPWQPEWSPDPPQELLYLP